MAQLNRVVVFIAGFTLQFNFFIGTGLGAGGAIGSYGLRVTDFIAITMAFILFATVNGKRQLASLAIYCGLCCALFMPSLVLRDKFTAVLAFHFLLYALFGLFLAISLNNLLALTVFCQGVLAGLLASVGLLAAADFGLPTTWLASVGLAAGYAAEYGGYVRDAPRYSGLWGHPNEAAHVAALASGAGAYLFMSRRSPTLLVLTCAGVLTTFYFTLSRGGLVVSCLTLAMVILVSPGRMPRWLALLAIVAAMGAIGQVDDLSARLTTDIRVESNFQERLYSTVSGIGLAVMAPFGQDTADFAVALERIAGATSPHNGFVFLAAALGFPAVVGFLWAIAINLSRIQQSGGPFFALLAAQITLSFFFESLPNTISYIEAVGLLLGRAYLMTVLGAPYREPSPTP